MIELNGNIAKLRIFRKLDSIVHLRILGRSGCLQGEVISELHVNGMRHSVTEELPDPSKVNNFQLVGPSDNRGETMSTRANRLLILSVVSRAQHIHHTRGVANCFSPKVQRTSDSRSSLVTQLCLVCCFPGFACWPFRPQHNYSATVGVTGGAVKRI